LVLLALLVLLPFVLSLRIEESRAGSSNFGVEDCFLIFERADGGGELNDDDVRESSPDSTDDGFFLTRKIGLLRESGLVISCSDTSDDREPVLLKVGR